MQRFYLELLEGLTTLCVRADRLRAGADKADALAFAQQTAEDTTLEDLQRVATAETARTSSSSGSGSDSGPHETASHASYALLAVGQERVKRLEHIFDDYEGQLLRCEAEITKVAYSGYDLYSLRSTLAAKDERR